MNDKSDKIDMIDPDDEKKRLLEQLEDCIECDRDDELFSDNLSDLRAWYRDHGRDLDYDAAAAWQALGGRPHAQSNEGADVIRLPLQRAAYERASMRPRSHRIGSHLRNVNTGPVRATLGGKTEISSMPEDYSTGTWSGPFPIDVPDTPLAAWTKGYVVIDAASYRRSGASGVSVDVHVHLDTEFGEDSVDAMALHLCLRDHTEKIRWEGVLTPNEPETDTIELSGISIGEFREWSWSSEFVRQSRP